jgi:hypothetical protein
MNPFMPIKVSGATEIRSLVGSLAGADDVARQAALARLAVIGARAIPHLVEAYRTTNDVAVRATVLRAMEPIGDARAAEVARDAIRTGGDLAVAAIAVFRRLVQAVPSPVGPAAFEILVSTALDSSLEHRVRLAAIRALEGLPHGMAAEIAETMGDSQRSETDAIWRDSLEGHLPDQPALLRDALNALGKDAPLTELGRLVDRIRAHESKVPERNRADWQALRGSVHQVLAMRGSRVALHDLRESLERATASLPPSFLAAAHAVGDSSCLDAIVAAYSRSDRSEARWRLWLLQTFRAIAAREKITRRHAVIKRISTRWPEATQALYG